jgi:predicted permease
MRAEIFFTAFLGILPILLLISLGYALGRIQFLGPAFLTELNKLTYYIAIPAFLIVNIARAELSEGMLLPAIVAMSITVILVAAAGYLIPRLRGESHLRAASLSQCGFRSNTVFIGLPLLVFCLPEEHPALKLAILLIAPSSALLNIITVLVFVLPSHHLGKSLGGLLRGLFTNPLILAALSGFLLLWFGMPIPRPMDISLGLIGNLALPLALFCIGGSLVEFRPAQSGAIALFPIFQKLAVAPLLAWCLCWLGGLNQDITLVVVVFCACPTATATYTLACQMGGDRLMTSTCIALTTLLSIPTLVLILSLLLP